jgi:hypothetical protein
MEVLLDRQPEPLAELAEDCTAKQRSVPSHTQSAAASARALRIASGSLSSGAHSRDPLARNDEREFSHATKQPDRQITKSLSSPSRKNIPLHPDGQIYGITPRVSPERGAFRDRHERGLGCGGRGGCD